MQLLIPSAGKTRTLVVRVVEGWTEWPTSHLAAGRRPAGRRSHRRWTAGNRRLHAKSVNGGIVETCESHTTVAALLLATAVAAASTAALTPVAAATSTTLVAV